MIGLRFNDFKVVTPKMRGGIATLGQKLDCGLRFVSKGKMAEKCGTCYAVPGTAKFDMQIYDSCEAGPSSQFKWLCVCSINTEQCA